MALDDTDRFPPEPVISGAHSLIRNGLMQTDMDANFYRIRNLDTSNLVLDEIPSQTADPHKWFRSYDQGTHAFGFSQPTFSDIAGNITLQQQAGITRLGRIIVGEWRGTPINRDFLPRLNVILPPLDNVSLNSKRIVDLADPVDDDDAVNLRFVHGIESGIQPKAAVRVATTENFLLATLDHPVDGVMLNDNDRVLVKNQTGSRHYQNGIWLAHPGAWTRAPDCDTVDELVTATCFVLEGTANATQTWIQLTPPPFHISNANEPPPYPEFSLFSTTIVAQAGPGLDQTGALLFVVGTPNRISVDANVDIDINYAGQDSIGIVGTIFQGTWEGDILSGEFGGTGVNNHAFKVTLAGDFTTSLGAAAPIGSFLNFNLLGATTLTLPSVGTLATLHGDETFTNKHISASQVDSGVLLITNGGTSANNAVSALLNLLPNVTGHAGQSLHTDGADHFYWA